MTVADLIAILQAMPADAPCLAGADGTLAMPPARAPRLARVVLFPDGTADELAREDAVPAVIFE